MKISGEKCLTIETYSILRSTISRVCLTLSTLVEHPAFLLLSGTSLKVLIALLARLQQCPDGSVSLTYAEAGVYGISCGAYADALTQLKAVGWLVPVGVDAVNGRTVRYRVTIPEEASDAG